MLTSPMELLYSFPRRKTNEEKQSFRAAVQSYLSDLGYETKVETGSFGSQSLIAGDPERADYLITAGRSGSAVITLLEIARTLPKNQRHKACFVLFEKERTASASYRKAHKAVEKQLVLHLETVGTGDRIRMFPTKALKTDRKKLTSLYRACGYFGRKSVLVQEDSLPGSISPFPIAVRICSIKNGKKEAFRNRIRAESVPEITNINILRAAITTYLTCGAAQ